MKTLITKTEEQLQSEINSLPLPPHEVTTPRFVIIEEAMRHNLERTIEAAGGVHRLMPHVKTHRAKWIVSWMMKNGAEHFKAATPAEVEICLAAGAPHILWAYPTANRPNIDRVVDAAHAHPSAKVQVLFDCKEGFSVWSAAIDERQIKNVQLVLDLDSGMGRTGAEIEGNAAELALMAQAVGLFGGWHLYDGHIQDIDRNIRVEKNKETVVRLRKLFAKFEGKDISTELIASGSWSFDIWPHDVAGLVSPGSFTYSSAQHTCELPHLDWKIAAYVLTSVVSCRPGSATLDAGSKAISPDMPMTKRFSGAGDITGMKEEHSIVSSDDFKVGQRIPIVPRHACTTAYLYPEALVLTQDGQWETREQLGSQR